MGKKIGELAVHLRNDAGELFSFLPGEDVPDWAAERMGDHCFAAEDVAAAPAPDPDTGSGMVHGGPPPRAGRGSSAEAWADYALDHDVEVDDGQARDDIIAACEKAGVPT